MPFCQSGKNATIHQVPTMLATSKHILFPGQAHLLTTGPDDPFFGSGYLMDSGFFYAVVIFWAEAAAMPFVYCSM